MVGCSRSKEGVSSLSLTTHFLRAFRYLLLGMVTTAVGHSRMSE